MHCFGKISACPRHSIFIPYETRPWAAFEWRVSSALRSCFPPITAGAVVLSYPFDHESWYCREFQLQDFTLTAEYWYSHFRVSPDILQTLIYSVTLDLNLTRLHLHSHQVVRQGHSLSEGLIWFVSSDTACAAIRRETALPGQWDVGKASVLNRASWYWLAKGEGFWKQENNCSSYCIETPPNRFRCTLYKGNLKLWYGYHFQSGHAHYFSDSYISVWYVRSLGITFITGGNVMWQARCFALCTILPHWKALSTVAVCVSLPWPWLQI